MKALSELCYDRRLNIITPSSGVATIDVSHGRFFVINMVSDVTSLNFSNTPSSGVVQVSLALQQDAVGGRSIT